MCRILMRESRRENSHPPAGAVGTIISVSVLLIIRERTVLCKPASQILKQLKAVSAQITAFVIEGWEK